MKQARRPACPEDQQGQNTSKAKDLQSSKSSHFSQARRSARPEEPAVVQKTTSSTTEKVMQIRGVVAAAHAGPKSDQSGILSNL